MAEKRPSEETLANSSCQDYDDNWQEAHDSNFIKINLKRRPAVRRKVGDDDIEDDDNNSESSPLVHQKIETEGMKVSPIPNRKNLKELKLHYPENPEKLSRDLRQTSEQDLLEQDQNGHTPLHVIVGSGHSNKLTYIFILMVHSKYGSDYIDMKGGLHGETALHIAVQIGDVDSVKILLAFGADINACDYGGKTPLDYIVNKLEDDKKYTAVNLILKSFDAKTGQEMMAKNKQLGHHRDPSSSKLWSIAADMPESQDKVEKATHMGLDEYVSTIETVHKLEKYLKEEYKSYHDISNHDYQVVLGLQQFELQGWKSTCNPAMQFQIQGGSRILCLDGGGMRGLIQIEILSAIEKLTGRNITDIFDWIIGTSTGGIVALGLVYGKKSLAELRQVYFKLKEEIFAKSGFGIGYNTEALESILKDNFDANIKMSDVKEPKVLISSVHKRTTNIQLTFFNNCFNDEYSEELVWKVARYTSAAPMNFSECDGYVDGGVLANNPSEYGLTAIQNYHRQEGITLNISCVVSVGTGIFPATDLGSTNAHEHVFHLLALKKKAANLMTMITKALLASEDVAQNSRSRCMEQHIPFFRFSPKLDCEIESGETNNSALIDMIMATRSQATDHWNEQLSDLVIIIERVENYCKHMNKRRLRDKRQRHALRHK